jgi:glyoxylase-like metal-dependent hydrolase (beta-lactamase superfamily II)
MPTPRYEVFALRYAHLAERTQGSNLIFPDDHAAPMPLDYFVWVVRGGGRVIVLDTGFDAASADRRNRRWLRSPIEAMRGLGIEASEVKDVVLSHMHWDHAGHWAEFPKARFHLQDAEMARRRGVSVRADTSPQISSSPCKI